MQRSCVHQLRANSPAKHNNAYYHRCLLALRAPSCWLRQCCGVTADSCSSQVTVAAALRLKHRTCYGLLSAQRYPINQRCDSDRRSILQKILQLRLVGRSIWQHPRVRIAICRTLVNLLAWHSSSRSSCGWGTGGSVANSDVRR
jgi:hypothetical protein